MVCKKNQEVKNTVTVQAIVHPFLLERVAKNMPAGLTLDELISCQKIDIFSRKHLVVTLDGMVVEAKYWRCVRPKPGVIVCLRSMPMGGSGGKNPLRAILTLAIAIAAPQIGAALAVQGSFLTSSLITTAVNIAGKLAVNALVPPGKSKVNTAAGRDQPSYFIQGAQNRIKPFTPIPQVLGRHRMVPPYAARPYTETIGGKQYLRLLFCWGYGPLDISDFKIGETRLLEFEGVEIENRFGYPDDDPITLYSKSVFQNDLNIKLSQTNGFEVRTTEPNADEISVDVTFPRGLVKYDSEGNKTAQTVRLEVQYSPAGANDWTAGVESLKNKSIQYTSDILAPGIHNFNPMEAGYITRYRKRIDCLVLDKATGDVGIIFGQRQSGFYQDGRPGKSSTGEPTAPFVPDTKLKLAEITHVGNTIATQITDFRLALFERGLIGSINDFVPTLYNTNQIQVSAGGVKFKGIEVAAKQTSSVSHAVRFSVVKGQYDVRIRRITADYDHDEKIFGEVYWTALRVIRYQHPINKKGLALTALRIQATDQLSGIIERFNAIVHSIVPDWDGNQWVEQPTSNPASLYRHVLQGNSNEQALLDNRLDLGTLEAWHEDCNLKQQTFNHIVDYTASVHDMLVNISASGRATPTIIDGQWSVVRDLPQVVPIQHFTPRNTFGFEAEKTFEDVPHGLRVRFIDEINNWLQGERLVYDEGYDQNSATKFEVIEFPGITNPDHLWKEARYHLGAIRLRPEIFSFYTDLEYIVCTRGDLIRFTHDVPLLGLASGRIKKLNDDGVNVTTVDLDTALTMQAGKNYVCRFRLEDGSSALKNLITTPGEIKSIQFGEPVPLTEGLQVGDLFMFGEQGSESIELIVKAIEPQEDLKAKITCLSAATAIHDLDTGAIPDYIPTISIPPELQRRDPPVVANVQSGSEVVLINQDRSFLTRIVVTLTPPDLYNKLETRVYIKAKDEKDYRVAKLYDSSPFNVSIVDVEEGEIYDIKLQYITDDNLITLPTYITGHTVVALSGIPSDVNNFNINILGGTAYLSWDAALDPDLSYYKIRFSPKTMGVTWGGAIDLVEKVSKPSTTITTPVAVGTYLIKAIDVRGNESAKESLIVSTIASVAGLNAVATIDEAPSFTGAKSNTVYIDGGLRLSGVDAIDDWADVDTVGFFDNGQAGLNFSGKYMFANTLDLGAVYTSTLTAGLDIVGLDISDNVDTWQDMDNVESFDSSVNPSQWGVALEVRTTDDAPTISPVWTAWKKFIVGEYTARAFEWRVNLTSLESGITPKITGLSVQVDMPDRVESGENITSGANVKSVSFATPFKTSPAIGVSIEDMATGDYYTITNKTTNGFNIEFLDRSDNTVNRTFDYVATGYGSKSI